MMIHKMILTDEDMHPVAVQIPYKEWLEIEIAIGERKMHRTSISKFSGSIKLSEDPLKFQKKIRHEWK